MRTPSRPSPSQLRLYPVASPNVLALQYLHRLNASSPKFGDQLCNILYGAEYVNCLPSLGGDNLVWLVDYLDNVRYCIVLTNFPLKPA